MAAANALLSTLQPGAKILLTDDLYFGVKELLDKIYARWGLSYDQACMGAVPWR